MKTKLKYILAILLMISISFLFSNYNVPKVRYHQHQRDHHSIDNTLVQKNTGVFSSHLPIMKVETEEKNLKTFKYLVDDEKKHNQDSVKASVSYYDRMQKYNSLEDSPTLQENAKFRIRKGSSSEYDKKSYLTQFKSSDWTDNKKVSLSEMTADSDWSLHGPYLDKTLIRNYLAYNLTGEIMDYSPNVRFIELFLNEEYQGLYLLTEKIDYNQDGRINITRTNPESAKTSYILKLDGGNQNPYYNLSTFNDYTGRNGLKSRTDNTLEIIYPQETLTSEQKHHIADEISQFEKSLASFDSADWYLGYPSFINVNSFVDYFILNEFMMNEDAGSLSTYYYKDLNGKLNITAWDFNSIFNNYVTEISTVKPFVLTNKIWFRQLVKDPHFTDKVIRRYRELRENELSDDYLLNYIDETIIYLGPAIERNNDRWAHNFLKENDLLIPEDRNARTYEEAVNQLKETLVGRGAYMDEYIEILFTRSHDSTNKIFRERSGE